MSRISYRCLPEERKLPAAEKSQWGVFCDKKCVGHIKIDDDAKIRSHNLRVWRPVLYESSFNPIEFPHLDGLDEVEDVNEPYVLTNDDDEAEHQLELHHPSLMTMHEARTWLRSLIKQ